MPTKKKRIIISLDDELYCQLLKTQKVFKYKTKSETIAAICESSMLLVRK